ncbi:MAG: nitroreductase family protein, partial [Clostridia bacterium]|nr:nitroreductase family protein [Clostridia bacterium]
GTPGGCGLEDASLVMGNLLNAAYAVGLGSCWIHRAKETFETPEGKALMAKWGVPADMVGVGNTILGYAADPLPEARPRKENYVIRG